jgi:hypothetical protein
VDVQLSVLSSSAQHLVHQAAVLSRAALQQYYYSAPSAAAFVTLVPRALADQVTRSEVGGKGIEISVA